MEQYFYVDSNNQRQGPVDANQLPNFGVKRNTLVWKEGMNEWTEAGKIPELSSYFTQSSVPPPPPYQPSYPPTGNKPDNYLIWSILSTVLCCLPLGIVAIVYSSKVDSQWNAKNYEGAREAAKNAKLFCLISLGGGLLGGIMYFIMLMIGVFAS